MSIYIWTWIIAELVNDQKAFCLNVECAKQVYLVEFIVFWISLLLLQWRWLYQSSSVFYSNWSVWWVVPFTHTRSGIILPVDPPIVYLLICDSFKILVCRGWRKLYMQIECKRQWLYMCWFVCTVKIFYLCAVPDYLQNLVLLLAT
jgi:hypothetical protein